MSIRKRRGMVVFVLHALLAALAGFGAEAQASGWWDTEIGIPGMDDVVRALIVFDDGTGPALYAGGYFNIAGQQYAVGIAKWEGGAWVPVGGGMGGSGTQDAVFSLLVYDDGTGPALYAGGSFTKAGGLPANAIAGWDGALWRPLDSGCTDGFPFTIVYALAEFDDGTGPALYAAGRFTRAGGEIVKHIAKWDGASWSDVGGGMEGVGSGHRVNALRVWDDGSGPALYVGGMFTGAGGVISPGIVKWDGTSWWGVGGGVGGVYPYVRALAAYDDGTGPALHVGGNFTEVGGMYSSLIAKWDGTRWHPFEVGLTSWNWWVTSMIVFDDGSGPALFVGGKFTQTTDGMIVNRIAKWDGLAWSPLGEGLDDNVYSLGSYDDGRGLDLYVGGRFTQAGGEQANRIAEWSYPWLRGDLNCDGAINAFDVDPFVLALTSAPDFEAYYAAYPQCNPMLADVNADGYVDAFDINPFVELLSSR